MGKNFQGINGNWSGKVGNNVGRMQGGRTIISIYQPSVANPNTTDQQMSRLRFKLLSQFFSEIITAVRVGYPKSGVRSSYNQACSMNNPGAITGTFPNFKIAFDKVLIANGSLDMVYAPAGSVDGSDIAATWTDNSGMGDASASDKVALVVYNTAKRQAIYNLESAERSERSAVVSTPASWAGDSVEAWLFLHRLKDKVASKSSYLGNFTL